MKTLYFALLIALITLASAGSMKIRLGQQRHRATGGLVYDLACDGAAGPVVWDVVGLPHGVSMNGNSIVISSDAVAGTYTIQISATDASGQTAQSIVNLSIVFGAAGTAGSAGGAAGNAGINGGAGGVGGSPAGGSGSPAGGSPAGGSPAGGSPAGGSPAGGSPAGGSPAGGAPGSSPRLDGILASFSTVTQFTTPSYPGNRYPSSGLPSGSDPNAYNPVPDRIGSDNAPPSPSNRNPITPDDVALKAASQRYQNAVKGITNLLSIIDQARANKNKAQNDMGPYTQALNNAISRQRDVQNGIISIELRVTQIQSAIAGAQAQHDDLKDKIDDLAGQRAGWNAQRTTILDRINADEARRSALLEQLNRVNADLASLIELLRTTQERCAKIDADLAKAKSDLAARQNDLRTLTSRRIQAQNDVNNKQDIVNRLRAQLDAAEKDLADAKITLNDIRREEDLLPGQIAALQSKVNDLTAQSAACARQVADIQARIDALKGGDIASLTQQIEDLTNKIMGDRKQVTEIDGQLADSLQDLEKYKADLADLADTIAYLNSQTVTVNTQLRQAYASGNDANTAVAHARQNLNAVNQRFQEESRIESEATLNLERARAEQALAKLALDEIVARYSNALPYAIVPNGNGVGAGSPSGNNPSGSPLGPATRGTDGFAVADWTHYLSSAFGAGINPAFDGNVNALYPFVFRLGANAVPAGGAGGLRGSGAGGAGGLGGLGGIAGAGSGCGGAAGARSLTGRIVAVGDQGVQVQTQQGQVVDLVFAPCTQLSSNQQDYQPSVGDQMVAKGTYSKINVMSCSQGVALA